MLELSPIVQTNPLTETAFNTLVVNFRKAYFVNSGFYQKMKLHREPMIFLNEQLQQLHREMDKLGNSEMMRDIEGASHGYIQIKIIDLWKADKRIKSLYRAILAYCSLRNKDVNTVATAIAEYRSLHRVKTIIHRMQAKIRNKKEMKASPKHFELLQRKTFDTVYLKVFLKKTAAYEDVAEFLRKLDSVRRVNVTHQQSGKVDITVYPELAYDISEAQEEIESSLTAYFAKNPNDPVFKPEPISSISDTAYSQIIDHLLNFGKNLESQQIKTDEEGYRNHFVAHLNALSDKYGTKGEAFNRKGKSDILMFDMHGNNMFIAECKLWKGEAYLLEAIDQLLTNYINWRDEKTAIIIFNRDTKKFTDLVSTAIKAVESHSLHHQSLGQRKDTAYSFLFHNPQDKKKIIKLELILFNFA